MVKRRKIKTKRRKIQKGGNIPTFVGKALNYSNLNTWPGVTNHGGDHYSLNDYPVDLNAGLLRSQGDTFFKPNLMSGGYTYKNNRKFYSISRNSSRRKRSSKRKKYKGGNFPLYGDLKMTSNVIQNNLANTHNILQGNPQSVSPLPWKDQYTNI